MGLLPLVSLLLLAGFISGQKDPHVLSDRSTIVQLFEWKHSDVAEECERFLAPKGFAGVQISPVQENLVIPGRSWFERYQVVSYKLITRSGDETAFKDMVRRCNNVGIRVYVDIILNHMASDNSLPKITGVGGTTADPLNFSYPAVPYGPDDFHSQCTVDPNEQFAVNVHNCMVANSPDLNQASDHVRGKMIEFLNRLVDSGVAGFRVDLATNMSPNDLEYIFSHVNNLKTEYGFPAGARPFVYQEVIDLGDGPIHSKDYTAYGRVVEFKYSRDLANAFNGKNATKSLANVGPGRGFLPDGDAFVSVDNHDNQRGLGSASGGEVLTYKDPKHYKMATAFILAYPYGYPRVMSSFAFNSGMPGMLQGPPADGNEKIVSPPINKNGTCGGGWVCEHRWSAIANMVGFRNAVAGTGVNNWWDNGNDQIAFCRGNKGFIAFNDESNQDLKQSLQTCLPAGTYCDVISGTIENGICTGKTVTVGQDGKANIEIPRNSEDGVLAININSKVASSTSTTTQPPQPSQPPQPPVEPPRPPQQSLPPQPPRLIYPFNLYNYYYRRPFNFFFPFYPYRRY